MAAFTLNAGTTVSISATTTTANVAIDMSGKESVRILVVGTGQCFVTSGIGNGTAATTSSTPVTTGAEAFAIPANHTYVAAITSSGTATVYFTPGVGT